jgi:DUF4097 and DUF4098 domain-containing protein YvlB
MKAKILIFLLTFILLVSPVFSIDEVKNLKLPAEGIRELRIDCGAGSLKVIGDPSLSAIEVTANIVADGIDEDEKADYFKDHVKLTLDKKGNTASLVSQIEKRGHLFVFRDARIDLTVRMPHAMDLNIDDGSGSMEVENIKGDVSIEDGSGSIYVRRIIGRLEINDGSGEIEVYDVIGDVSVDDGSGSMEIIKVGGTVTVDDGSGSITVEDVDKDVVFKHTGSGGVHVNNVRGRVIR